MLWFQYVEISPAIERFRVHKGGQNTSTCGNGNKARFLWFHSWNRLDIGRNPVIRFCPAHEVDGIGIIRFHTCIQDQIHAVLQVEDFTNSELFPRRYVQRRYRVGGVRCRERLVVETPDEALHELPVGDLPVRVELVCVNDDWGASGVSLDGEVKTVCGSDVFVEFSPKREIFESGFKVNHVR